MSAIHTVRELNEELANQINQEALRNPQSPYANKFVGIANGKVVVVSDDLDKMIERLRQIEPDSAKCFCVEASRDYSEVIELWHESQIIRASASIRGWAVALNPSSVLSSRGCCQILFVVIRCAW